MTYQGKVLNGVVVLDNGTKLPEGTRVRVEPADEREEAQRAAWANEMLKLAGTVDDLPPDLAEDHDHYLHGTPKRKP
jgi:hypothetical protein